MEHVIRFWSNPDHYADHPIGNLAITQHFIGGFDEFFSVALQ